jgi:hypothetical protein
LIRKLISVEILEYLRCQVREQIVREIISLIGGHTPYQKRGNEKPTDNAGHPPGHDANVGRRVNVLDNFSNADN